jgi:2-isopropylmalate synthase
VCLKHGDEKVERVCLGDGPVDAAISAIEQIIKPVEHTFELYQINSVSRGQDTLGDVHVKLNASGRTFTGHGLSTDIIEASILAYLRACSKLSSWTEKQAAMAM